MNSKTIVAIATVAVVMAASAAVYIVTVGNDGTSSNTPPEGYEAMVWLDYNGANPVEGRTLYASSGALLSSEGVGKTIKDLIQNAFPNHSIIFSANGNIMSVDGIANTSNKAWTVFKWMSPSGWTVFSDKPENYIDGMNIAVCYAERTTIEGVVVYSPSDALKDVEIGYTVFFFIQFKELDLIAQTEWMERIVENGSTTEEEMKQGMWIAGTGKNNNEALANAVLKRFFSGYEWRTEFNNEGASINYLVTVEIEGSGGSVEQEREGLFEYGLRIDMYGWLLSFFGFSDTLVGDGGEYGEWTYWSQYIYHPEAPTLNDPNHWNYNHLAFGLFDITEYRYFALVLQTTGSSEDDDYFIPLPTPSTIPDGL